MTTMTHEANARELEDALTAVAAAASAACRRPRVGAGVNDR